MPRKSKPGVMKITFEIKIATHNKFKKHADTESGNMTKHLNQLIKNDLKK